MTEPTIEFVIKRTDEVLMTIQPNEADWLPSKMDTFNYRGDMFMITSHHYDYDSDVITVYVTKESV